MDHFNFKNFNFDSHAGVDFFGMCPVCKTNYEPFAIRLIANQEEKQLLHIICQKCGVASLALVAVQMNSVKAVELITDLNPEEIVRLSQSGLIRANDVLKLHLDLQNNRI